MKTLVSRFVKDQSGATAIEYGLIAAGISVAIIAVVQGLGTNLKATFSQRFQRPQVSVVCVPLREGSGRLPGPFRLSVSGLLTRLSTRRRLKLRGTNIEPTCRC